MIEESLNSIADLHLKFEDTLKGHLSDLILKSFIQLFGEQNQINSMFPPLERPPEASMGDYAFPCFRLAALAKQKPDVIAQKLSEKLAVQSDVWIDRVETKGAFLNLFVNYKQLSQWLLPQIQSDFYFQSVAQHSPYTHMKTMIEYSQPNTHKEFHIGHCRNVCLGDAMTRIFEYLGYPVIPVNYIGDEGTHVAKCLWQAAKWNDDQLPTSNFTEWYGKRYVEANQKLEKADEETRKQYQSEISHVLKEIESKTGKFYHFWRKTRDECMSDFHSIYEWLDARFDHIFYESDVSEESQTIVDEYYQKGLFVKDQGAIGIHLEDFGLGFLLARKSDGTGLYITKDLALARRKFENFQIHKSIYIVGSEQIFHFKQVFKALELMGFEHAKDCYHLSYAHVKLPEGKISSRKGNAIVFRLLKDILEEAITPYLEKYQTEWAETEIKAILRKLAVGSIKYGMLQADPQKEIVFDAENWTRLEGNTGPYLMYSYARAVSILEKGRKEGFTPNYSSCGLDWSQEEKEVLKYLYDFNQTVQLAGKEYKPSTICHFLFDMCKSFNRFYANVPVLKIDQTEIKQGRLALIEGFAKVLYKGLSLLGISAPYKM